MMNQMGNRPVSPVWQGQPGSFNPQLQGNHFAQNASRHEILIQQVKKLTESPAERADALYTLSLQRESAPDLAIFLWESPATMTALLSEIIQIYPALSAITMSQSSAPLPVNIRVSGRVIHALALFQCIAGHEETRTSFIRANIPIYLFPFLHTTNSSRECECFKLTSLGIIGSLVKAESPEITEYLLEKQFVPLCLRILKFGQEMSKIVAAYIIQKIMSDQTGRAEVCSSTERVDTMLKVLNITVTELASNYNVRLAKNIILSYQYLLKVPEARAQAIRMPLTKLASTKLSESCDQSFSSFVTQLLGINLAH